MLQSTKMTDKQKRWDKTWDIKEENCVKKAMNIINKNERKVMFARHKKEQGDIKSTSSSSILRVEQVVKGFDRRPTLLQYLL